MKKKPNQTEGEDRDVIRTKAPGSALTKTMRAQWDAESKLMRSELTPYFTKALSSGRDLIVCRFGHCTPYTSIEQFDANLLQRSKGLLRTISKRLIVAGAIRAAGAPSLRIRPYGLFGAHAVAIDFTMIVVCKRGAGAAVMSILQGLALPRRQRPHWPGASPVCNPLGSVDELMAAIEQIWRPKARLTMPHLDGPKPIQRAARRSIRDRFCRVFEEVRPERLTSFIRMARNGQKVVRL